MVADLLPLFAMSFASTLVFVPVCRLIITRLGYTTEPQPDRWHRRPAARFGGIAIALAVLTSLAGVADLRQSAWPLVCFAVAFAVGFAAETKTLRPTDKVVAEVVLGALVLYAGYRLHWVESATADSILTVLWVVAITSAFERLNGMEALCAGAAAAVLAALLLSDSVVGPVFRPATQEIPYAVVFLGASLGFLLYNLHPASILLGETGSIFLGTAVSLLALAPAFREQGSGTVLLILAAPLLVLLLPVFNAAMPRERRRQDWSVSIALSEPTFVTGLLSIAVLAAGARIAAARGGQSGSTVIVIAVLSGLAAVLILAGIVARTRLSQDVREDALLLRHGRITPLAFVRTREYRIAPQILLDLCVIVTAYYAAYRLRFSGPEFAANFVFCIRSLPLVVATQIVALWATGEYRSLVRSLRLNRIARLSWGVLIGIVVAQLGLLYLYRFESYSRAVFVIHGALLLLLLVASRAVIVLLTTHLARRRRRQGGRLVIYGTTNGEALAASELLRSRWPGYQLRGFIDDDPAKRRLQIGEHAVIGSYDELVLMIANRSIEAVVFNKGTTEADRLRELVTVCADHDVTLMQVRFELESAVPMETPQSSAAAVPAYHSPRTPR